MREGDRKRSIEWARSMVEQNAFVLDTETLGKDHDSGLCDIAVVAMSGEVIFDSLVRPARPIPPEATAVHGITDDAVEDAPEFWTIAADLAAVLQGRIVTTYNVSFDGAVINACCRAAGLPEIARGWHCSMIAFSEFRGERGRYNSYKWHRLGDAVAFLGLEEAKYHRALADAEATRQVILKMASYTETPSQTEPVAVTVQPSLFAVETPKDLSRWDR